MGRRARIPFDRTAHLRFDRFLLGGRLVEQSQVGLLQVVDVHLEVLVDAQPRVVHLAQGGRLFVQVLQTIG